MFTLLKKLLGKSRSATATPPPALAPAMPEPMSQKPKLEVAHFSLAAITAKFPEELRPLVVKMPEAGVTVAFPVPSILKQLATGSVRISLATVHRQAPAGIFGPLPAGDKRTVEVPLAEVFRHVNASALKRRPEQKPLPVPSEAYNLFSDRSNPRAITPPPAVEEPPPASAVNGALAPPPELRLAPAPSPEPARVLAPPPELAAPAKAPALNGAPATLAIPLAKVAGAWPELLRTEIAALDPDTVVVLPPAEVTAGMAQGRVAFPWGRLRAWLSPAAPGESAVDAATELVLPLKIVAPAFLVLQKLATAGRKVAAVDESIPALFNGAAPLAAPACEVAPAKDPEPVPESAPPAAAQSDGAPADVVARTAALPGISGAIVALPEGLGVAHALPDGMKPDVLAAFLPQIFGRLNQYSGEMQLGEVDEVLFTARGAHCQIYRLANLYFAVLGKPGESLPWPELRLLCAELAGPSTSNP